MPKYLFPINQEESDRERGGLCCRTLLVSAKDELDAWDCATNILKQRGTLGTWERLGAPRKVNY